MSGIKLLLILVIAVLIVVLFKYVQIKRQIRNLSKQMTDLTTGKSEKMLDISLVDKDIEQLAAVLNQYNEKQRQSIASILRHEMYLKESIANISHDLRTPLTVILGHLQLLKKENLSAGQTQRIETIFNKAERMKELIQTFYDLSVIDAKEVTPVREDFNLTNLLINLITENAPALEAKGISPVIGLPDHSVYLHSDYGMVERIFQNLIINAIRYSSGSIKIDLKQGKEKSAIFIIENPIDSKVEIDPNRLFERFYTGDKSRHNSGTGVGLAVVKLMFEKAQEILKRRAKPRRLGTDGKREKFSRKYAFSCMLECGFCGGTLTRRSWHSGSQYNKVIWQCVTATKKGKKFCPDSKGIAEETIEQAFIESYRLLCQNNKDVLDEFIARTEETLSDSNASKQLAKVEKDIATLDAKRAKLVDMRLEEIIDKETYEQKYFDLSSQIEQLQKQRESLQESAETESTMKKRIAEFRRTLEENEVLDTFDRYVFESIVEKVIVGGYDEDGNKDPAMLTFIYKTGFKNSLDGTNFKPPRKNSKAAKQNAGLCSHTTDEAKSMCSYHSDDTCRGCLPAHQRVNCSADRSGKLLRQNG